MIDYPTQASECSEVCPGDCSSCPERMVCSCLQVSEAEIVGAIQTLGVRTLKELRHTTGAGTGCNCCHTELRAYLRVNLAVMTAEVCSTV